MVRVEVVNNSVLGVMEDAKVMASGCRAELPSHDTKHKLLLAVSD